MKQESPWALPRSSSTQTGKTVNIKGIAETYLQSPQIRLFSADDITIK